MFSSFQKQMQIHTAIFLYIFNFGVSRCIYFNIIADCRQFIYLHYIHIFPHIYLYVKIYIQKARLCAASKLTPNIVVYYMLYRDL